MAQAGGKREAVQRRKRPRDVLGQKGSEKMT
jgi:hypothetical protein